MISARKCGIFLTIYFRITSGILVGNGSLLGSRQSIKLPSRQYLPVPEPARKYTGRAVSSSVPEENLQVVSLERFSTRKGYSSDRTRCCNFNDSSHIEATTGLPTLKNVVADYGQLILPKIRENGPAWYYLQGNKPFSSSKSSIDFHEPQAVPEAPTALTTGRYGHYVGENVRPIFEEQNDEPIINRKPSQNVPSNVFPETSLSIVQSTGRPGESGWNEPTKLFPSSQDAITAISTLNRFMNTVWNGTSYNSELHLPPNPILGLILSHYGRYVPGSQAPRVYSYMAANNIHNIRPFGKYKYEYDEEPTCVY